jgi:hypothetical protein
MEIQQRLIKVRDLILFSIGFIIGLFLVTLVTTKNYENAFRESLLIIIFTGLAIAFVSRKV